jgi:hypothetical protein
MAPDEPPPSPRGERDYRGLVVLLVLGSLEVLIIYLLLVVETPLAPIVRRAVEHWFGRILVALSVFVLLSFGMAALLAWMEKRGRRSDDRGSRSSTSP